MNAWHKAVEDPLFIIFEINSIALRWPQMSVDVCMEVNK